jgi:hypothetical protein
LQESDFSSLITSLTNVDLVRTVVFTNNSTWTDSTVGKTMVEDRFEVAGAARDNLSSIGGYYSSNQQDINIIVAKGTYASLAEAQADLAGTVIYYQLATPIETELLSNGILQGQPNSTIYIDNILEDADIYGTNATISDSDLPILELEEIIKFNSDGTQTKLSVANATIAVDGLSFTHTGLTSGDYVYFTYKIDGNYFNSTSTIINYDNKVVVSGSGTTAGKVYKLVPTIIDENIVWTKVEV